MGNCCDCGAACKSVGTKVKDCEKAWFGINHHRGTCGNCLSCLSSCKYAAKRGADFNLGYAFYVSGSGSGLSGNRGGNAGTSQKASERNRRGF